MIISLTNIYRDIWMAGGVLKKLTEKKEHENVDYNEQRHPVEALRCRYALK